MATTGVGVILGQQDTVAAHLVDGADMLAVGADDIGMFLDLVEQIALRLAVGAP